GAAARVDEVVEAEAADPFLFDDAEDFVDFADVFLGDGEAHADADAGVAAVADAANGVAERAGAAAEAIVALFAAVDADADVGDADLRNALRLLLVDERAVRRESDADAERHGQFREIE